MPFEPLREGRILYLIDDRSVPLNPGVKGHNVKNHLPGKPRPEGRGVSLLLAIRVGTDVRSAKGYGLLTGK